MFRTFGGFLIWGIGPLQGLTYEGVSESFRTGRLEQELQMVQLSATRYRCIAILRVSLVSFAAITLCVVSQRVLVVVVYFVMTQTGKILAKSSHTEQQNTGKTRTYIL
jgi:hypothetical protein